MSLDPLAGNLSRFRQAVPWGGDLERVLRAGLCDITHVQGDDWRAWRLRVRVPDDLRERFGTAPEIQLVATTNVVQARDLQRAAEAAWQADARINADLVVVVSDVSGLANHLRTVPVVQIDGQPIVQQRVAWSWPGGTLAEQLARDLPFEDLFDVTDPVNRSGHFGRKEELSVLCRQLRRGGGVGVYGLRKVGKTTLARLAEATLRAEGALCAWVDAQGLPLKQQTGAGLAGRWAAGLPHSAGRGSPMDRLIATVDQLTGEGRRVLLTLDEFDLLFEARREEAGLLELFGRLRALSQSSAAGRLAVMFIGRDPRLLSPPMLEGASNPLLAWVRDAWVGPMDRHAATEMLRKLGKRCGLTVGHRTAEHGWRWTGGHPLLHRQYGSAALSVLRGERDGAGRSSLTHLRTDDDLDAIERAFRRRQRCRDVGREVLELLGGRYPDALHLLRDLAAADGPAARRPCWLAGGDGDVGPSQVLREFGLVDDALEIARFWTWYLQVIAPPIEERLVG